MKNILVEVLNMAIIVRYCAKEKRTRSGILMIVRISQVGNIRTYFHEILRAPYTVTETAQFNCVKNCTKN